MTKWEGLIWYGWLWRWWKGPPTKECGWPIVILWFIRNTYLVIQMTKIYLTYTFGLLPQFLAHSSQNPWNFMRYKSTGTSFAIIFGLLSSVPEIASEPWRWNGCLVIHTSPFPPQLGLYSWCDFWKAPKWGGETGCQGYQPWIEGWNFQPPPTPPTEGLDWVQLLMASDVISP